AICRLRPRVRNSSPRRDDKSAAPAPDRGRPANKPQSKGAAAPDDSCAHGSRQQHLGQYLRGSLTSLVRTTLPSSETRTSNRSPGCAVRSPKSSPKHVATKKSRYPWERGSPFPLGVLKIHALTAQNRCNCLSQRHLLHSAFYSAVAQPAVAPAP